MLSGLLITFDNARNAKATSAGTGLVNQATTNDPAVSALSARLDALIDLLSANAARGVVPVQLSRGDQPAGHTQSRTKTKSKTNKNAHQNAGGYYCWSHGPNASHNSVDCNQIREGHQDAATAANKMGGAVVFTSQRK
jgi:hypothetical protein